jgi:hypothetical protein
MTAGQNRRVARAKPTTATTGKVDEAKVASLALESLNGRTLTLNDLDQTGDR